jgi:uncharacterized protein YbjT (DUF2867 family)
VNNATPGGQVERGSILLTGATGYIGGRLLPLLAATARPVRLLLRDPGRLAAPAHHPAQAPETR